MNRVDIVLDNSGVEFFADLALANLLVGKCNVKKVVFHGKVCVFVKFLLMNLKFVEKLKYEELKLWNYLIEILFSKPKKKFYPLSFI